VLVITFFSCSLACRLSRVRSNLSVPSSTAAYLPVFTLEPSGAGRLEIAVVAGRGPILSRDGRLLIYSTAGSPPSSSPRQRSMVRTCGRWQMRRRPYSTRSSRLTDVSWTPSFFPDGRIAFQSDRSGRMEVWVMNGDGTGAKQITN